MSDRAVAGALVIARRQSNRITTRVKQRNNEMFREHMTSGQTDNAIALNPNQPKRQYDCIILVLQGGGALGAYQAGVFEGMNEVGYLPNWVTGVSIGAVNGALIAGNPPKQ